MQNTNRSYKKEDLFLQLKGLGTPRNGIVLMHSALRLVGEVEGGAEGLLDALIEYFTAEGGLFCVPTHTWANLSHPERYTLDMTDPHTCLGAFSNVAAADPRAIRSENPTHSMAVFGDRARAEAFVQGEINVSSGTAPESCYGKLYRAGGHVLLVGVAHNKNTYLHCVEELLGTENRLSAPKAVSVKRLSGEVINRELRGHASTLTKDISQRFPKYETAFRYHGAITDGFLGDAPTQLCDARIMHDVMALILSRSEGVDPLADERALDPRLYCKEAL